MTVKSFQDIIESIEHLSAEDQDDLFELIRKRRIEKRRMEIASHAREVLASFHAGEARVGSVDDLIDDLLSD